MVMKMKKSNILGIYLITCIIDQIIKLIIKFNMKVEDTIMIIPNFFNIEYLQNTGAAFSSFEGMRYILIIISLLIFILLIKFIKKNEMLRSLEIVSLGLILGGLVGNLIDRVFYGYVIDYLAFTIFGYSFAVFNLADSFIVIGVILIIVDIIKKEMESRNNSVSSR